MCSVLTGALLEATAALGSRSALPYLLPQSPSGHAVLKGECCTKVCIEMFSLSLFRLLHSVLHAHNVDVEKEERPFLHYRVHTTLMHTRKKCTATLFTYFKLHFLKYFEEKTPK